MKREKSLEDIQSKYPHLTIVETNSSISDYPSDIMEALIGFKDIEEANEIAKKYYGIAHLYLLDRKAGHHFYRRLGACAWDGIDVESIISDDDSLWYENGRAYLNEISEFGLPDIEADRIITAANEKRDDEMLLLHEGCLVEVLPKEPVSFNYDSHSYVIGLIKY